MLTTRTRRRQHRRADWEDFLDPILAVDPDPVVVPPDATEAEIQEIKVLAMRRRHELCRQLRHPDDHERPIDYADGLLGLAKMISETALADRGLRSAAHGISRHGNRFRVQAWGYCRRADGTEYVGHRHIGYAATLEEAVKVREDYYRLKHRLDITSDLPPWLMELHSAALALQSERDCQQREADRSEADDETPEPVGQVDFKAEIAAYWQWRNGWQASTSVRRI